MNAGALVNCTRASKLRLGAMMLALLACTAMELSAQVTQPLVAIHDSELTRALDSTNSPATGSTPTGFGTTGLQWWPTNWHYFVMPESMKEAMVSDGTAYTSVGDSNIVAGSLLTNGVPKYPILISLASEAIRDDEIAPLTNYVAAGGFLFVGSSSFSRTTNGTSRGDFAFANELGLHMVNAALTNWAANLTFTRQSNHRLISHIPDGTLVWEMPASSEEIPWGVSPHPSDPRLAHLVWRVQSSDATVLASGGPGPTLTIKQYGKGCFIYYGAMQPLIGHGGWSPAMYAYMIFRKSIEWAFENNKVPIPKLSPWPYPFDAALMVRHDLENFTNEVAAIAASSGFEFTNGVKGDYYFVTGTLREDASSVYDTNVMVIGLRQAVTNFGATIGSHNGGLKNPINPALVRGNYDYWHWGPDEVLNVTPTNYPDGKSFASNSVWMSFLDLESWLSGVTNGLRAFTGCYFNSTREDSYDVLAKLGVNIAGETKVTPFPHWPGSTRTSGKKYSFISEPVSDWFVSTNIAQSIEPWHPPHTHTFATVHNAVDFYYGLGALVNLYSHTMSTGLGDAGLLAPDYITYSMNTTLHPRLWPASGVLVYQWWQQRSNAQISASFSTNGITSIAAFTISGAKDTNTSVELLIPGSGVAYGLQVLTNGTVAGSNVFRAVGQAVKLRVGTNITTAQFRYVLGPRALNDYFTTLPGTTLDIPAPGPLTNDFTGAGSRLTAFLLNGPTNGTVNFLTNGAFTYQPAPAFSGVDTFSYQVFDGVTSSSPATVSIFVGGTDAPFWDDFWRSSEPGVLSPWQPQSGAWTISGGLIKGGTNALNSYGTAYVPNTWSNNYAQTRLKFPANGYGGGLDVKLNQFTGARYAAWIYPDNSTGGSNVLKLIKFQNWNSFAYLGVGSVPMQTVSLGSVGTNWHTLGIGFSTNQLAVYYDGARVMSVSDNEAQPYLLGGIGLDFWTPNTNYTFTADDTSVRPLVAADAYIAKQNQTLNIAAPGVLGNDVEVFGTNLTAAVVASPTNGQLNLNADGSFSYLANSDYIGPDSFVYQAFDGSNILGQALVSITVGTSNTAPVLPTQVYRVVPEAVPLLITNTATDADSPVQNLTYQLLSPPNGAAIDSNGIISWTPPIAPTATFILTTVVTDDGTPALSATNSFPVTVNHVNHAPVLTAQTNLTIVELSSITVTNIASDQDNDSLSYSLISPPAGALIGTNTGIITWTPTEAQGPSTNTLTTVVTDNGVPPLSATNSFVVIVQESNSPPVFVQTPTNRTIIETFPMTVTNNATDSDLPANPLTYSLVGAPTNASISTAGVITWTPSEAQGPSTNVFTTVVTDTNAAAINTKSFSITNSFTVIVLESNSPPILPAQTIRTIAPLTALFVTNTATDSDLPANPLSYSLLIAPTNAAISTNGVISWTPTLAQNNSSNVFQTSVSDYNPIAFNSTNLSRTNSFSVLVSNTPTVVPDTAVLVGEGCVPTNNAIDPGETVTVAFALKNVGLGNTVNLVATLLQTNGVVPVSPPQNYGVLPAGGAAVTNAFTFGANGSCGGNITALIQFQDGAQNLGTGTISFVLGPVITVLTQNFDGVTAPALPAGWTSTGSGGQSPWYTTNSTADTPPNAAFSVDSTTMGVNELVSPAFTQPLYSAQLTFRNNYDLETDTQFLTNGFDGGVLELKVGTGAFVDILAAGGSFVAGGYTKTLDTRFSNPLAGRRAWSGVSGGYTNVIVNLPSTNAGQTVQLRWRCGSDDSTGRPGWRIDSVSVTGRACCTNSPPVIATQSNLYNVIETTLLTVTNMLIDPGLPANPVVFSLLSPPTGASIDTNTGVITWIPSEGQGPGTNLITTIARNSAVPGLAATNTFTVIILESNLPPILPNQTNRTLFGLQSLTVTNTATDADLPANPLNYILQTGPTNAAIDANGIISWTPLISQVPSTNLFTTVVTDTDPSAVNATSLSATNSFTVVVNAIHNGPSLPVRTNRTVVELTTMTVNNSATDNDVPPRALNYALISPPAGASISSNGVVTWTPDESQGPGTNIIMTVVTDDGTPPLSATNSFTVNVLESNTPPVLPVQSNRTLTGLQTLSVTNAATDSDLPANPLTYTLQTGPSNAVIDANGIISWTPVVSQVPSTNLFTTVVTDTNPPAINETSFSSTNSFFVIVNAIHNGPQLPLQTNHSVLELTTLCVTNTATVNDVPPRALTYTLANPPAGALISTNGVITWQPTESQGPGTNIITTIVTDDGSPPLSATNNFTLIVLESNSPPVLPVQTNYILVGMQTLVVTNSGTDSDIPANALTYILQSGPSNAEMDASGVITWTPDLSQVPSTNLFTTVVTDSNPAAVNATSLSATNSFYVTVNLPDQTPRTILIQSITLSNNIATITWTSVSGNTYRLQYKTNWDDASWTDFSPDVPATGATTSAQDDISAQTQRLYRVMLVP